MRKLKTAAVLVALVGIAVPVGLSAQLKNWTWNKYRLKFQLPSDWKVTKNTGTAFIAKGKGVVMKIGPWEGSRSDTAETVATKALSTYTVVGNAQVMGRKDLGANGGLERFIIYGKGVYNLKGRSKGKPVRFGIIGLISQKSVNNAYVRFWWFDSGPHAATNNKTTYTVATSFSSF